MPNEVDETDERGRAGLFQTTHWTEIFSAGAGDDPQGQEALAALLKRYWKAVFCYLRYRGYETEEAKDLTQGFFQEVVLGRALIERADRARGRFRTFLLRSLDRYVTSIHRTEIAKRRMPKGGLVSLEEVDWLSVTEPVQDTTPVEVFDYTWACALLDQVLAELEGKCRETGTDTHWELFRERILAPIMESTEAPPLNQLCKRYRIEKKARVSHILLTVKRRFQAILRRQVRQLVDSDDEVDDEIRYLMKLFSGSGASS